MVTLANLIHIHEPMLRSPRVSLFLLGLSLAANPACSPLSTQTTPMHRQGQIDLKSCRLPNYDREVLCGKHQVFEDRTAKSGRKITLNIVVLPSLVRTPAPDPVFFLAGGPGQGAARIVTGGDDSLARELRRERDLVFVDLRGTGDSHPLQCNTQAGGSTVQNYFLDIFRPETIRSCREALSKIAELRHYTTPIALADLDEVRAALGYDKINLYGASWGTLAALQYLRRYPQHVRSTALAGVSTPTTKLPLHFARGAQQAMDRLIEDCAADDGCRAAFPKLKEEFSSVLHTFDTGPVRFDLPHPVTKSVQSVQLSRGTYVERLRLMLYDHSTAALIPLLIHRAAQRDWTTFGKVATLLTSASAFGIGLGSYFTITCSESVPTIAEEEIARETHGTFLGEYRTRRHQNACREWPRGEIAPDYYRPVQSNVPVLILSGEVDPATPAEFGRDAAKFLPNSRQVLLRNTPHNYRSECATNLTVEFIAKGSVQTLNTTCAERIRRPRFLTELPERYNR